MEPSSISKAAFSRRQVMQGGAILAAGGVAALGLEGCATPSKAGTSKTGSVTFANWGAAEAFTAPVFKSFGTGFESANKTPVKLLTIPFLQYQDVLTSRMVSRQTPDVAQSFGLYSGGFAAIKGLADLSPYFSDTELGDIADAESGRFGGKLNAITWCPLPNLLFWRKDLVERAGVDPLAGPKTWDEFEKILRFNYGQGTSGLVLTTKTEPSVYVWWLQFLWAFGGDLITADGEVLLDSPDSIKFGTWIQEMYKNRWMTQGVDGTAGRNTFATGNAAMTIDGSFGTSLFAPKGGTYDSVGGVGILPAGPGLTAARLTSSTHQLVIFEQSKNKAEAAKFIKFLLSKEEGAAYYKAAGLPPARISSLKAGAAADPIFELVVTASKLVKNPPMGGNFVAIEDTFMKGMQQIWNGTDPKQAFGSAAKEIRTILLTKK